MGHARRRRGVTKDRKLDAWDFQLGDGVRPGWDGDGTVSSFAEAEREWQGLRWDAWRIWSRRPSVSPPRGAVVHDGLETVEELADFRARQPRAAKVIGEYIDLWVDLVERHRHQLAEQSARRAAAEKAGLLMVGGRVLDPERSQQPETGGLDEQEEELTWTE